MYLRAQFWLGSGPNQKEQIDLVTLDINTNHLTPIGPEQVPVGVRLVGFAGTASDLFAVLALDAGAEPGLAIGPIDTSTGRVSLRWPVPALTWGDGPNARGAVSWRGDFYFFVNESWHSPTRVLRFRPDAADLTQVAELDAGVIAAAVSICAPPP